MNDFSQVSGLSVTPIAQDLVLWGEGPQGRPWWCRWAAGCPLVAASGAEKKSDICTMCYVRRKIEIYFLFISGAILIIYYNFPSVDGGVFRENWINTRAADALGLYIATPTADMMMMILYSHWLVGDQRSVSLSCWSPVIIVMYIQ